MVCIEVIWSRQLGVKEQESCNYNRMIRSNGRCELIEYNVPGIRCHMVSWPASGGKDTMMCGKDAILYGGKINRKQNKTSGLRFTAHLH